ncbi:MAG: glutamate--cysteine ligase, partial [Kofleriaceae bacterium]|nr:glutamate--cysteine ligase [Kofleriaceae bacterium]
MYIVDSNESELVTRADQLQTYFSTAGKPRGQWRIGSEHELIGVRADGSAPDYATGIGKVLAQFAERGWTPIEEQGFVIALARGDAQVTIEPGGQFELAARPVVTDQEFVVDLNEHLAVLRAVGRDLGITWLSSGLRPFGKRSDVPWMPKQRYDVMRDYMPTVGSRGLDMMLRTATVQTNMDFADQADAAKKMRALYAVTSLMTALWANSSIVDGEATDYQSYRAWIWRDTDNARSGMPAFVFEREDIFAAYTEWALDVPMYFIHRGRYVPMPAGFTFRQYMAQGHGSERANMSDWGLHLSTLFPDVRMKKFIEVRGCDCGTPEMIAALGPFARGLAYDDAACTAAIALTAELDMAARQQLADDVG